MREQMNEEKRKTQDLDIMLKRRIDGETGFVNLRKRKILAGEIYFEIFLFVKGF